MKYKLYISTVGLIIFFSCNHDTTGITKKGINFFEKEKYVEAVSEFNYAIKKNHHDTTALYYRGVSYTLLEEYEKAKPDFDKVIIMNVNAINSYFFRGSCNFFLENYKDAIYDYTVFIKNIHRNKIISKFLTTAYFHRAICFAKTKQYYEAIPDLRKTVESDSTNAHAYFVLGQLEIEINNSNNLGLSYIKKAASLGDTGAIEYLRNL